MIFLAQEHGGRKIRAFSLSDQFLDDFSGKQPEWGPVGYFTYKRTYARPRAEGGTEEFWETCRRVVEGVYDVQKKHCKQLHLPWDDRKAQSSAQEMYSRMWEFKFLPPGRGLWAMGTDLIYRKGGAPLNNCGFVGTDQIRTDFAAPFCFLMDMSMLGVGVGGDTRGAGTVRIVEPKMSDEPHIVEDSREGWVDIVRVVLNSFVGTGRYPSEIDYSMVRERGATIAGFGGVASGPGPLVDLVENIKKTLSTPGLITSTQIVDLFNYIGKCVVAGGVRRTAEIMFGDFDDEAFVTLKHDAEALLDRRWASNNSVFGSVGMDYEKIAQSIAKNGEPGIIWLENMRHYRRMDGKYGNYDVRVVGSNPCAEQSLESFELCCLVETFPARHDSFEDYLRTLKFAYLYAKTVTLIPTHEPRTNAVLMRNRRIGCSMSGIAQAMSKLGRREFLRWCDEGYDYVKTLDRIYAEWLCVPKSVKVTSVKPSGTVSLLCGSTPGIHYPHAEYYYRTIRVANTSPLVQRCISAGYRVEKAVAEPDTSVVYFPIHEKHFTKSEHDVSLWEQMANASDLQQYWADNQVSITVKFQKHEECQIAPALEHFESKLKSVSMMPVSEHGYVQAPLQKISEDEYNKAVIGLRELDLSDSVHEQEDKFCDGDACLLPQ